MRTLFLLLAVLSPSAFAEQEKHSVNPGEGLVPDAQTAVAIAVAVWSPIYGATQIQGEKPFVATLREGIWHVSGSPPAGWVGGGAEAEIAQKDGQILRVSHGK
jgi:hypothetical protein